MLLGFPWGHILLAAPGVLGDPVLHWDNVRGNGCCLLPDPRAWSPATSPSYRVGGSMSITSALAILQLGRGYGKGKVGFSVLALYPTQWERELDSAGVGGFAGLTLGEGKWCQPPLWVQRAVCPGDMGQAWLQQWALPPVPVSHGPHRAHAATMGHAHEPGLCQEGTEIRDTWVL